MLASRPRRARARRGYGYFGGWGPCCCAGTRICLISPCGGPLVGARIDLYAGASAVAGCTTDSAGCCLFAQSGTYDVQSTVAGVVHDFGARTLSGAAINLTVPSGAGLVCCGPITVPTRLLLTDAAGSITLSYTVGSSPPQWTGNTAVPVLQAFTWTCGPGPAISTWGPLGPGSTGICYVMQCNAASALRLNLSRGWVTGCSPSDGHTHYRANDPGVLGCQYDPCATGCFGETGTTGSTGDANPSNTSPFAISFTMTPYASNNPVADPVGGGVTISG